MDWREWLSLVICTVAGGLKLYGLHAAVGGIAP
jgi:hypothetical protein